MIHKFLEKRRKTKAFKYFLSKVTNINLKDNLNNLSINNDKILRVIGTGKSLQNVELISDNNIDNMVVNMFVLDDRFYMIKPKYYVIADKIFTIKGNIYNNALIKLIESVDWEMYLFLPFKFKKDTLDLFAKNENIKLCYFNSVEYYGPEEYKEYCYIHNLAMPAMDNVMVASLYIALCLNYKIINILGADHDWTRYLQVNEQNQLCREDHHCYDKTESTPPVVFSKLKVHEILKEYSRVFSSYWELRDIANNRNIKIINSTKGSFIDAFDRK